MIRISFSGQSVWQSMPTEPAERGLSTANRQTARISFIALRWLGCAFKVSLRSDFPFEFKHPFGPDQPFTYLLDLAHDGAQLVILNQFYDLLEFRNESWRIVKRTGVYEKDRLDFVNPIGNTDDLFTDIDLSAFPESVKFLCYMIQKSGGAPSTDIVTVYSEEERLLKQESEKWLIYLVA